MFFIQAMFLPKVISADKIPFYVELNFRKKRWLVKRSYNPNNNSIKSYLTCFPRSIDYLLSKYENIFLLGSFTSCMDDFLYEKIT